MFVGVEDCGGSWCLLVSEIVMVVGVCWCRRSSRRAWRSRSLALRSKVESLGGTRTTTSVGTGSMTDGGSEALTGLRRLAVVPIEGSLVVADSLTSAMAGPS